MPEDLTRYVLEVNPWTPLEDLREFTLMRGVIVGAWASVETVLKEIALKASRLEPYIDVDVRIPKKNSEIIEYLKVLTTIKGPIYSIADDLKSLMLNFESHSNDRNMIAHAHMQVLPNWGATFSSYVAKGDKIGGDYFAYEERRLTLLQMDELARAATVLSHKAQAIRQKFLEHLE